MYSSCMRSAMLHASETWPLTKTNLQRNDRAMIRQICSLKPADVAAVRSSELLAMPWPRFEREKASPVWACGTFLWRSQNSMWYTDWWQAGRGDQVWDLLCVQLASYLIRGPLMWMMPLNLHVNQKSDYYNDMMDWCQSRAGPSSYILFLWISSIILHVHYCTFINHWYVQLHNDVPYQASR